MRNYDGWNNIFDSGNYTLETLIRVYDGEEYTDYDKISAPKINRSLNGSALSIGNVNTATLEVSILTDDTIPLGAKVVVLGRLTTDSMQTDYVSFGTFWIDRRSYGYGGLVSLTCYDAMMRANTLFNYTAEGILTTKTMADVVEDVATRIGVDIDGRTSILEDEAGTEHPLYLMTPPTDMNMSEALGYIGQVNGGNWIITEENKLRLVPLFYEGDTVETTAILGSYSKEAETSISMVSMTDSNNNTYSYGDTNGFTLDLTNPYACDTFAMNLYGSLQGVLYRPYTITKAVMNPLYELGDTIAVNTTEIVDNEPVTVTFTSQIMQTTATYDLSFRIDTTAHDTGKTESEYPYESQFVRLLNTVTRVVDQTVTTLDNQVNGEQDTSIKNTLQQIKSSIGDLQLNYVSNATLTSYIRFDENGITLGKASAGEGEAQPIKLRISSNEMFFFQGEDDDASSENALAYFNDGELMVNFVNTQEKMTIGNFYWRLEDIDGSLSLVYQPPET